MSKMELSVLDFPLYHILANVILERSTPEKLTERYESLRKGAMFRGEFGEFLVTFIENHDQVGQIIKKRFVAAATEAQINARIGFLLCALELPAFFTVPSKACTDREKVIGTFGKQVQFL